ncbi:MAG: Mrp/NBP35 family ATP-binding protein [Clostridia bacterium]
MSDCDHDCSSCSSKCEDADMREKPHELSRIDKVIGVVSGKGGVGKSLVTALLAVATASRDKKVAILDADITGPSIPKMFGVSGSVEGDDLGMYPRNSKLGIKLISANLLVSNESDPVLWRGPLIAGMVKQFWTDVIWGDVNYMFVDMPPGTGDVPLTVFQSVKPDAIIIVTSPQELVSMIVGKAVKMANMMDIPVLGVVENMSYVKCPKCGEEFSIFGGSKIDEVATNYDLKVLGRLPLDVEFAKACDEGNIESITQNYLDNAIDAIFKLDKIAKK